MKRGFLQFFLCVIFLVLPVVVCAQDELVDTMKVQLPEGWSRPEVNRVAKAQKEKRKKLTKKELRAMELKQLEKQVDDGIMPLETKMTLTARYCKSYRDFTQGRWVVLDSMGMVSITESVNEQGTSDGTELRTENKALNTFLHKNAFLIQLDDSLYINLNKVKGENFRSRKGFEHAYLMGKQGIVFGAPPGRSLGVGFFVGAAIGVMAGIGHHALLHSGYPIVVMNSSEYNNKPFRGYILRGDGMPVQWIDEDVMSSLIGACPNSEEVLSSYQSIKPRKRKNSFAVQKSFMDQLGMLTNP